MDWPETHNSVPDGHYTKDEAINFVKSQLGVHQEADVSKEEFTKFFKKSNHEGYYLLNSPQERVVLPHIPKPEPRSGHWGGARY